MVRGDDGGAEDPQRARRGRHEALRGWNEKLVHLALGLFML